MTQQGSVTLAHAAWALLGSTCCREACLAYSSCYLSHFRWKDGVKASRAISCVLRDSCVLCCALLCCVLWLQCDFIASVLGLSKVGWIFTQAAKDKSDDYIMSSSEVSSQSFNVYHCKVSLRLAMVRPIDHVHICLQRDHNHQHATTFCNALVTLCMCAWPL